MEEPQAVSAAVSSAAADSAAAGGEAVGPRRSLSIESADVIRLMLQFCKEHGLTRTVQTMQEEAQVHLNIVESPDALVSDVKHGRWDNVLRHVSTLQLTPATLFLLYDQMLVELVELRELDLARDLLQRNHVMTLLKQDDPDRYMRLGRLVNLPAFDPRDAYPAGVSKEQRRNELAQALLDEIASVPPSRLLALIGQALKWQQQEGLLPPSSRLDLFTGGAPQERTAAVRPVRKPSGQLRLSEGSHAECAAFSPDGRWFVTGSVDGFVEVWDCDRATLHEDLEYQRKGELMSHSAAVLACAFASDSELLATGSQDGKVKVWRISDGVCVRKFPHAHSEGVTALCFSKDSTQLASGSFDHIVRIHGLRSGKMLKEFRGHTSYVNAVCFSPDGSRLLSGSSDGSMRVWDLKTSECVAVARPQMAMAGGELAIAGLLPMPRAADQVIVMSLSPTIHVMNLQGALVRTIALDRARAPAFVQGSLSAQGKYLYALAASGELFCFDPLTGTLEYELKAHDREPVGLAHHPQRGLLTTYSSDGVVRMWKS